MRIYLEVIEISEESEADFIRIDVTGWSEEDVEEAQQLLVWHARSVYNSYVVQRHFCRHDEDLPCYVDIVDVRG